MDANDIRYGTLLPALDSKQEGKKDNKKKALVGLAALLTLGGCSSAVYFGTGLIDRIRPQPEEEEVMVVTPTTRPYEPQPTPTEAVQDYACSPEEAEWWCLWYCCYNPTP